MAFLLYLLVYFFTHPDKIVIWSSLVASLFEKVSKRSARHSVASDIQGRISSYIKNNHASEILPYGLKFRWIKDGNSSSYIEEGDVIVVMDYHNNNAKNFINALRQYTSKAFIPMIRHELPPEILSAAELIIQEKIIREKRPDVLDVFRDEILPRQTSDSTRLIYDKFKQLDTFGYFDNIFLTEFVFAGNLSYGLEPAQKASEIKGFLEFLKNIENEDVPLDFHGEIFHTSIILVAKPYKRHSQGTAPYIRRAEKARDSGANSLYVTGREQNMDFVDDVVDGIKMKKIGTPVWSRDYKTLDKKRRRKNAKMALFRL